MIPPELIYEGEFIIRTYEIDRSRKITVSSLVNLMQEAAMQNVIDLKVSFWDLTQSNISWVLMRKNLQIFRLPALGETIRIVTHPAGFQKIFTFRDYKVYDKNEVLIAQSSSTWLLMNTKKRSIARIPETIRKRGAFDTSDCLPHAHNKLPIVQKPDFQRDYSVNWHDLDFNNHLNNIKYMQWMFESVDYYVNNIGQLDTMDIVYKAECYWKDTVRVSTQKMENNSYLHRLIRLSDNEVIADARTKWSPF